MQRYEVIESRHWKNIVTDASASIYGAVPWTTATDEGNWQVVTSGFTIQNTRTGTVGIGKVPWKTRAEAEQWVRDHS